MYGIHLDPSTEETDREAQAHTAIVFLAPEKIFCGIGSGFSGSIIKTKL